MDATRNSKRRWRNRVAPLTVCAALIVLLIWYVRGRPVWTDGGSVRIGQSDQSVREVLWTMPRPLEPEIFEGVEQQQIYDPSVSLDGTELYFVRGKPGSGAHLFMSRLRGNRWSEPEALDAVNGPSDDLGPRLSADGRWLFFASDRPGGLGGFDLWASQRQEDGGWGTPVNLGPSVNSEFNELNPDPTPDGKRLIFSTDRKAAGREQVQAWRGTIRQTSGVDYDLWIAQLEPAPAELAAKDAHEIPGVNTPFVEGASCMSPAGDFLYFASNRPGGFGKFDIYRCRVRGDAFGPVENLGPTINSAANETDPALGMMGFRLLFSSDRGNPAGIYALHTSDSREVFADRDGRPLPRIGWSAWSFLLSALLLIPLILALRLMDGRRLNTLQRCLLVSLLVHALITFVLSFVVVTRDVVHSIGKGEGGGEIAVNLGVPGDVEVGLAVRNQLSTDLSIQAPEPSPRVERTVTAEEMPAAQVAAAALRVDSPPPVFTSSPPPDISSPAVAVEAVAPPISQPKLADARANVPAPAEQAVAPSRQIPMNESGQTSPPPELVRLDAPGSAKLLNPHAAQVTQGVAPLAITLPLIAAPRAAAGSPADAPASAAPVEKPIPGSPQIAINETRSKLPPELMRFDAPKTAGARITPQADPKWSPGNAAALTVPPLVVTKRSSAPGAAVSTAPSEQPIPASSRIAAKDLAPGASRDLVRINAPEGTIPKPAEPSAAVQWAGDDKLSVGIAPIAPATARVPATASPELAASDVLSPANRPLASKALQKPSSEHSIALDSTTPSPSLTISAVPVPLGNTIDPAGITVTPSPFPRSQEQRKPLIEKLGGNKDSEEAVDRGLAYLARNQEPDGRWTFIGNGTDERPGRRPQSFHDMANTGLSVLAFITRDHTPDKPGPYRDSVDKALNFLVRMQEDDGDLRGPAHLRGPTSRKGDMYDHAIATLALAEAAAMTRDDRYGQAALRGAKFIVAAQDPRTGGWRYIPGEAGDSSVFGWQIMALRAAERLGFEIPAQTLRLASKYVRSAAPPGQSMLAGYRPGGNPTPTMTAEILYARMLLGEKLADAQIAQAIDFLIQQPPERREPNLYYWYYSALCMLGARSDEWRNWNAKTRDALIALQDRTGPTKGSWDVDPRYADRGGRIYMTSVAILTLEVYYRYQPLR